MMLEELYIHGIGIQLYIISCVHVLLLKKTTIYLFSAILASIICGCYKLVILCYIFKN